MGRVRELLAHSGIAVLAIVFALAFAAFNLAVALAREIVSSLQQWALDEQGRGGLNFTVFETEISYDEILYYAIALLLIVGALYATWQISCRYGRTCPECASRVPSEASVCRYCTSDLGSGPTDE